MSGTQLSTPVQPIELTAEGLAELKEELTQLKEVKLPSVVDRVAKAREYGDLSENAEYHDARSEQDFVQTRIDEIEEVLGKAVIVKKTQSTKKVGIGSVVSVKSNGKANKLTITGEFQGNPKEGKISSVSPLGKALVGKKKGDKVKVSAPAGEVEYTIENIA